MKNVLATFLTILMLIPISAFGEILTIRHSVKQTFGGGQSPDDARISGIALAKREALEKAGTYIESLTVVKNSQVEKDEILALTAGVLKAEVISQKNYHTNDAFGIEIVVNVVVDTSVLEERVKKLLQDKTHLTQLKDTQKREKELLQKVAQLEEENRKLTAKKQSTVQLEKEFQQASDGLTAVEWFNKASALWDGRKYAAPEKAIEHLNNAIKLQPAYADAYTMRGLAYFYLGQYQRAIEDCNEAIRLKPDNVPAYINRGLAYINLANYQRGIEDCNEALRLQPDNALAYNNRGLAYRRIGQNQRAIEDCNEAIRLRKPRWGLMKFLLKSDFAEAYLNRGFAYNNLGQHQRAIEDYSEAIRLKPDYADAYNNRGGAYTQLGQHQRAIEDYNQAIRLKPDYFQPYSNLGIAYNALGQYQLTIQNCNEAIRLKPDYADAYYLRGNAYLWQGNNNLGCRDAQKACELGNCKLQEWVKTNGKCL